MNRFQRFAARVLGIETGQFPPKIPVAPELAEATRKMLEHLTEQARASTVETEIAPGITIKTIRFGAPPVPPVPEIQRPGIKPPPDPAVDEPMSWELWKQLRAETSHPGWAPCRFANQMPSTPPVASFVFGMVKGDMGIWRSSFDACGFDEPTVVLPAITYLPAGMGIGLCTDLATAARAAELAEPILAGMDWTSSAEWMDRKKLLNETWNFHGIAQHAEKHVHLGSHLESLWTYLGDEALHAKPKVLS